MVNYARHFVTSILLLYVSRAEAQSCIGDKRALIAVATCAAVGWILNFAMVIGWLIVRARKRRENQASSNAVRSSAVPEAQYVKEVQTSPPVSPPPRSSSYMAQNWPVQPQ
ncbi:hypothetical protein FRC07_003530, partial [Ceratobasidium sp. 392]